MCDRTPPPGASDLQLAVRAIGEVVELIRDSPVGRVRLIAGEVSIEVERADAAQSPAVVLPAVEPVTVRSAPAMSPPAGSPPAVSDVVVTAPLLGVFYRRPAPDQPAFAEVGQRFEVGQQLAIVEAMKILNPVVADRAGILREVHVADGELVEYEQPLLSFEPC